MNDTLVLSTAYLPSIEYIVCIAASKNISIEQYETFPKQTFRNRCLIYSANGVLPLSIPIIKTKGNKSKTNEIEISYANNWILKHWRAIESAYNNSPYFLYYKDDLLDILNHQHKSLLNLNLELLQFILRKIQLKREISFSSDFLSLENNKNDFRYMFSPKKENNFVKTEPYYQVFSDKLGFIPNLSIIDLLFNQGPEARFYIESAAANLIY